MIRIFNARLLGRKFLLFRGTHSWELQVSTHVFQIRRRSPEWGNTPPLVNHFRDPYGKR